MNAPRREPRTEAGRIFYVGSNAEMAQHLGPKWTRLDVILAIEAEAAARPSDDLTAAWAEAERLAQMAGTHLCEVVHDDSPGVWTARTWRNDHSLNAVEEATGPTPAAALLALAERLEGEPG